MKSRGKSNTLYLHLQKTHWRQTIKGTDLQWEGPTLKKKWPFDYMANVWSVETWKKSYSNFKIAVIFLLLALTVANWKSIFQCMFFDQGTLNFQYEADSCNSILHHNFAAKIPRFGVTVTIHFHLLTPKWNYKI